MKPLRDLGAAKLTSRPPPLPLRASRPAPLAATRPPQAQKEHRSCATCCSSRLKLLLALRMPASFS